MQFSLNQTQKTILLIGLTLTIISFLFPCWKYSRKPGDPVLQTVDYQFIFSPPKFGGPTTGNEVIRQGELQKAAHAKALADSAVEKAYAEAYTNYVAAKETTSTVLFDNYYASLNREAQKYQVPIFENGLFTGEFYDSRLGPREGQPNLSGSSNIGKPMQIDFTRMLIQIAVISFVTAGLMLVKKS